MRVARARRCTRPFLERARRAEPGRRRVAVLAAGVCAGSVRRGASRDGRRRRTTGRLRGAVGDAPNAQMSMNKHNLPPFFAFARRRALLGGLEDARSRRWSAGRSPACSFSARLRARRSRPRPRRRRLEVVVDG